MARRGAETGELHLEIPRVGGGNIESHGDSSMTKRAASKPHTAAVPASLTRAPKGHAAWLTEVKSRIHAAQQRATLAVNHELIALYWSIGRDILDRQANAAWGDGILDRVSTDLRAAFPEMTGFSRSNLKYMRAFAEAWPSLDEIGQQPVGQLAWGQNVVLLTYQLVQSLPKGLEASLPSIEQIEAELAEPEVAQRRARKKGRR